MRELMLGRPDDAVGRLISLALPRMRDFRGVSRKAFDGKGNYTLGLKEQIIFPEINYDRIDVIKGLNVSFVTTARTDEEGRALRRRVLRREGGVRRVRGEHPVHLADHGAEVLGADTPAGERMAEQAAFLEFATKELSQVLNRWQEYQAEGTLEPG